ncbi:MAG: outer membrane lipid asymmetry maintenance protein MlaD [Desulfobulbaceae bacterium]|nr:outer membrane lipid asymmetry maintenance protein MlaD [Desulfobulbaceae bacterium]
MGNSRIEIMVGIFLVIGFLAFGWLALRLGEVSLLTQGRTYTLDAAFNNVSGLKKGSEIQLSGVTIGTVRTIRLDEDNMALVSMQLDQDVHLPVDSMASIKTQGIIGDKYIQLTLGGDTEMYKPGEILVDTESTVDIESLISKFAFGQVGANQPQEN